MTVCSFSLRRASAAITLALACSACTVLGPNYQRPSSEIASDWRSDNLPDASAVTSSQAKWQWWEQLNDPTLNALIADVLHNNRNLKIAALRVMESRAQLGVVDSTLYPQVQQLSGSVLNTERRQSGGYSANQWMYSAGLNIGWELDFWGRFRRSIEAADAAYLASIAKYDDVYLLLAAQTASLYAGIRTLESRLQFAHSNMAIQQRSLEITQRLYASGNDSELDVQQAKTQYLATASTIPALEASLRQTQNALAALLGRPPGPILEMASATGQIPAADLMLIADLPADLLRRRPDVRAAEMQLKAQSALIGVAEADFYPSITLLGSLGVSATSIAASPTTLDLGIGPSLKWNIFDYGRLKNNVRIQDARYQQLYLVYQDSVLQAAREVDDAAVAYAKTLEQVALLEQGEQAAQRSLEIANIQYREGMAGFERVLDAQRALFSQQERVVSNRGNLINSLIALYKAMGGGWDVQRQHRLLDEETLNSMKQRTDWGGLLDAPLISDKSNTSTP
ncbi:efflux transporter outer membrane subunit [Chitinibacter sp. SCUT-21]|uniref:efflux transporter outer membrane subunit n=1 Tax=Chitinibacter sp. SCUT-21 TaxID=2970891 RepID=UPI0035A73C42